jgi:sarcosine oxidase
LKAYYHRQAEEKGVLFLDHLWVRRVLQQGGIVQGIECRDLQDITPEGVEEILVKGELPFSKPTRLLFCDTLINAAGAWAGPLASLYGRRLPTVPVRRQVAILHSSELDLSPYGMVVDVSGLYFHPEGGNILAGYANPDEPEGYNLTSSGQGFFQEEIWPRLYARSTRFERLKYIGGWAGLYEKSPDRSAIVGRVQGFSNLYEAHSFSGHGVMQSYAVGRGLAELITRGRYEKVNLSPLRGERFREGQSVFEELFI